MTEHPILCSDSVVRAILAGTQTQDRRPMKRDEVTKAGIRGIIGGTGPAFVSPWRVGDLLWVREALRRETFVCLSNTRYVAHYVTRMGAEEPIVFGADGKPMDWRWKTTRLPPRFMPREASRITLRVLDVRVERDGEQWVWATTFERVTP